MSKLLIGYARSSTDEQDLTVQRNALMGLGVTPKRVYVDHGLTGRNIATSWFAEGVGCLPRRGTRWW